MNLPLWARYVAVDPPEGDAGVWAFAVLPDWTGQAWFNPRDAKRGAKRIEYATVAHLLCVPIPHGAREASAHPWSTHASIDADGEAYLYDAPPVYEGSFWLPSRRMGRAEPVELDASIARLFCVPIPEAPLEPAGSP